MTSSSSVGGGATSAAVAAAVLGDQLLLFGINETGKPPESKVVVMTETTDAVPTALLRSPVS